MLCLWDVFAASKEPSPQVTARDMNEESQPTSEPEPASIGNPQAGETDDSKSEHATDNKPDGNITGAEGEKHTTQS